jgi:transcriptional/translational regulatory protein YebC/TACO1
VVTEPADLVPVRAALETAGINVESAEVVQRPQTLVTLDAEKAPTLLRMVEALEDLDDVDAVHANFDVPAEVMEQAAS